MTWKPFSAEAFAEARAAGKPVLYLAAPLEIPAPEGFVAVRDERPDLRRRFRDYAAFVLAWNGAVVERLPMITELALSRARGAYRAPEAVAGDKPVWTGAVGAPPSGKLDPGFPRKALGQVLADTAPLTRDAYELLRYAAAEWKDDEAAARLKLETPPAALPAPRKPPFELLDDAAASALALTESFLRTGHKPDREAADKIMQWMFQELWDKDNGGFFDRVPDPLLAPLKPAAENAVALEALWRLRHLKGNANYQRWLEWALKALPQDIALARVQDMAARGRMELELVGRPGEPKTDALLAALNEHYLPRKIVSFVDPDDQDYILAHKLEAPSYPRLFGCLDFAPKASACAPSEVAAVLTALMAS